jgi:DNA-binding NarL/FixJ family response regulator
MYSTNRLANQLATTLLEGLCVKNPTAEQYKAAESFVNWVILPENKKEIDQEALTQKEWLCLNLAASGFSIEETAKQLSLATNTVKNYRERIRQKLQCKSMTQAVYRAFLLAEKDIILSENK